MQPHRKLRTIKQRPCIIKARCIRIALQSSLQGFEGFGLIAMGIFLGILIVGFIYEWKKGALEWD